MRSLTDMVVAALGVEDTEAGEEVDTTSSVVMIGAGMVGACVGSVVAVEVFSVVIFLFVVVVFRWERKIRTNGWSKEKRAQLVPNLNISWIQAVHYTAMSQEANRRRCSAYASSERNAAQESRG